MRCFTHTDSEAVGVCRACGRALCKECITEVTGACYCKGRCEKLPEQNRAEFDQYKTDFRESVEVFVKRVLRSAYLIPGLLLVTVGVTLKVPAAVAGVVSWILIAMGAILLLSYYYSKLKKGPAAKT